MESIEDLTVETEFNNQKQQAPSPVTTDKQNDDRLSDFEIKKVLSIAKVYESIVSGSSVEKLKSLGGVCYACIIETRNEIHIYWRFINNKP